MKIKDVRKLVVERKSSRNSKLTAKLEFCPDEPACDFLYILFFFVANVGLKPLTCLTDFRFSCAGLIGSLKEVSTNFSKISSKLIAILVIKVQS